LHWKGTNAQFSNREFWTQFDPAWRSLLSLRDPAATNLSVGARAHGRATRNFPHFTLLIDPPGG
jgi:hypothetical protein